MHKKLINLKSPDLLCLFEFFLDFEEFLELLCSQQLPQSELILSLKNAIIIFKILFYFAFSPQFPNMIGKICLVVLLACVLSEVWFIIFSITKTSNYE